MVNVKEGLNCSLIDLIDRIVSYINKYTTASDIDKLMLIAILAHKPEPRGVTKRRNAVAVAIYPTLSLLLRRYRLAIATQPLPIGVSTFSKAWIAIKQ